MRLLVSLLSVRRCGLLRLRPATSSTRLACLRAACPRNCCKAFPLVEVEAKEASCGVLLTQQLEGKTYLQRHKGACIHFNSGLCSVYSSRPSSCREYPWYRINNVLYVDRGCPGIQESGLGDRLEVEDLQEMARYYTTLPRWLRRLTIWLQVHW
ncbi:YkgJ family cysteine cluster protein [Oleiharenicola sp. Vm1]|uniref:YkgJ family cysteine cluster protein n=1 Tax=Oleiharenicola sp. Vm1 TaxID=3398393 RepID=UPI0039F5AE33